VSDDSTQPNKPFASRGFIAAAIVIGVIVLAGVVVLVTSLTAPHDPVAQPTSTPSGPVALGNDNSVCGLPGFETESSLTTAPDTKWELVGTVASPIDPKVGPGKIDSDGIRTCFAHTAEGALFATVNYVGLSSDARTRPLIVDLIEPGLGRDAVKTAASAGGGESPNSRLQVAGFKVNSYTAHEAVIDVAWTVTSSGGQLVSFPMVLHWVGSDWKVVLTDDGSFPFTLAPLSSLGGYIPWAGV
jgi:hypothetical protein